MPVSSVDVPGVPQPLDPADDGSAVPAVAAALHGHSSGSAGVQDVLAALRGTRLLVPVVAVLVSGDRTGEKDSEMALPKLVGRDGREAVLAFTGVSAMTDWRPDARPVQVPAEQAARAAVEEAADALVIDVAGPVTFAVEGHALRRFALGEPPSPPYEDPDVAAAVLAAARRTPGVDRIGLAPAEGSRLAVRLRVAPGHDPGAAARELGERLRHDISAHAPHGIELLIE